VTQAKVAGQLGIETETVSRMETGAIAATLSRLEERQAQSMMRASELGR